MSNVPQPAVSRAHAIVTLWSRGELLWKLRPEQARLKAEIEKSDKQLVVGNISRRWGKSFTLVLYAIEQAIKSGRKIRYATAFLTDLEEFILPAFNQILDDCPDHLRPTYVRTRKTWEFPGGGEIKLVGLDKNPNGLRGNAIGIIILDEAGFIANLRHVYTSVIVPATAKQSNVKIVFISTPPESPEHYFVELINKAQTQANGYYLCLTIDDISDLDPVERKRLLDEVGGEHSPTAQREFFCKIQIDATRSVAPSFDKAVHVRTLSPDHVKWQVFGDAGGVRDKTVFLRAGFDHVTGLVVFRDELHFPPGTPTSEIVAAYRAKFGTGHTLILDAPGQLLIDYASLGLPAALPAKDEFSAGLLLLNNAFHNSRVAINPECALLIRSLEGGMLNKQRTDYERSEALGHLDSIAACIYALRCVDRTTDLRPKPGRDSIFTLPNQYDPQVDALRGLTHRR